MSTTQTQIRDRFATAATSGPPTDLQREAVVDIRNKVIALASEIEAWVPAGCNKAIALTALEDVQMRANRGIFTDAEVVR